MARCAKAHETIDVLESNINDRDDKIRILKAENLSAVAVAKSLDKELVETTSIYELDKELILNVYNSDVKTWKEEIDHANKNHIILQQMFEMFQNENSICSQPKLLDSADSAVLCSKCAGELRDFSAEYLCGSFMAPTCVACKLDANLRIIEGETADPISFCTADGIPSS